MAGLTRRIVETNGIRMHVAEQGEGPVVVLCHGFPESWYSWRHQLPALAKAGFRAVAPDMRGYGQTERPEAVELYSLLHLIGDMVGLLDALGAETAVIAGHGWGAPVAWHAALLRPDRFRGVIGLSVPFLPRGQVFPSRNPPQTNDALFYQSYFQAPGVAEAELEEDISFTIRSSLCSASAEALPQITRRDPGGHVCMVPRAGGILANRANPPSLPSWLTECDVSFYAEQFARTGYRGGLNWYRNIERNWASLAPFEGARVMVPALYVVGDRDIVLAFRGMGDVVSGLLDNVPRLQRTAILPQCGHWTQQERPEEVNAAIIEFLQHQIQPAPRIGTWGRR